MLLSLQKAHIDKGKVRVVDNSWFELSVRAGETVTDLMGEAKLLWVEALVPPVPSIMSTAIVHRRECRFTVLEVIALHASGSWACGL